MQCGRYVRPRTMRGELTCTCHSWFQILQTGAKGRSLSERGRRLRPRLGKMGNAPFRAPPSVVLPAIVLAAGGAAVYVHYIRTVRAKRSVNRGPEAEPRTDPGRCDSDRIEGRFPINSDLGSSSEAGDSIPESEFFPRFPVLRCSRPSFNVQVEIQRR